MTLVTHDLSVLTLALFRGLTFSPIHVIITNLALLLNSSPTIILAKAKARSSSATITISIIYQNAKNGLFSAKSAHICGVLLRLWRCSELDIHIKEE